MTASLMEVVNLDARPLISPLKNVGPRPFKNWKFEDILDAIEKACETVDIVEVWIPLVESGDVEMLKGSSVKQPRRRLKEVAPILDEAAMELRRGKKKARAGIEAIALCETYLEKIQLLLDMKSPQELQALVYQD